MATLTSFEDLLPQADTLEHAGIRAKLVQVLKSQGEILPSANSPRGKLWHLVNTPDSSIDDCAEIIQLDSALAARIFRVANSAAYGAKADNISDAVRRLGMKFIRQEVFNAEVFKQYSNWVLPPEWDMFWLRNIFIARLCERLAGTVSITNGSEYLAGLIHDMGWLFLATYFPNDYQGMIETGKPAGEVEKEFLPFSHAEIAGAIAARSLLPDRSIYAIMHHHDPEITDPDATITADRDDDFLAIVLSVCDSVADCCNMDMFSPCQLTIEQIQAGPRVKWLSQFGKTPDLQSLAFEELSKSKEIYEVYFSNHKFN